MASGRLGAVDLSATTNTTVYTVPSAKTAAFSVNICNRNASAVTVRLALSATGTPGVTEWIEYDAPIAGNSVLERTGLILDTGKLVVAYSSTANVSVVAYGVEE
jgi:hypothetical protein